MALKVVEIHLAEDRCDDATEALKDLSLDHWRQPGGRFDCIVSCVVVSEHTGTALDRLHERLTNRSEFLVLVRPLDAVLPRPLAMRSGHRSPPDSAAAVSREEVYAGIAYTARLDGTYVALVLTASIVAAIGLTRDNTAAVIGAMVVAPLLGPTMAVALGLVLGDIPLIRRSLTTSAVGLGLALVSSVALGLALDPDPNIRELSSRTVVSVWDIVLALAAGCAGALSYTSGVPGYLTGVMVSVALLPPAVASGILATSASSQGALSALLLAGSNVTALTLSAMLTFIWRGMRPRNWWQEARAQRTARVGVLIFAVLLVALAVLIVASGQLG